MPEGTSPNAILALLAANLGGPKALPQASQALTKPISGMSRNQYMLPGAPHVPLTRRVGLASLSVDTVLDQWASWRMESRRLANVYEWHLNRQLIEMGGTGKITQIHERGVAGLKQIRDIRDTGPAGGARLLQ